MTVVKGTRNLKSNLKCQTNVLSLNLPEVLMVSKCDQTATISQCEPCVTKALWQEDFAGWTETLKGMLCVSIRCQGCDIFDENVLSRQSQQMQT